MAYAEGTSVALEKSISEIISLVKKHGATQIGQAEDDGFYAIQFRLAERMIRFKLPFKSIEQMPKYNGRNHLLTASQRKERHDQHKRQRGRALLLVIKAKLESVEIGIETVEQAFLANVVMADGRTVHERIAEPLAVEYQTGLPSTVAGLLGGPQ